MLRKGLEQVVSWSLGDILKKSDGESDDGPVWSQIC